MPSHVSLTLSLPTFLSTVTTSVMALQTSGSTSCAVILPEFLASVIQGIQTLISTIVQQSLSAAVGAPPVPVSIQGLPTTTQSSNYPHLPIHPQLVGSQHALLYMWMTLFRYHGINLASSICIESKQGKISQCLLLFPHNVVF